MTFGVDDVQVKVDGEWFVIRVLSQQVRASAKLLAQINRLLLQSSVYTKDLSLTHLQRLELMPQTQIYLLLKVDESGEGKLKVKTETLVAMLTRVDVYTVHGVESLVTDDVVDKEAGAGTSYSDVLWDHAEAMAPNESIGLRALESRERVMM